MASRKCSTFLTCSSSSTLDPEKSKTKGRALGSKNFSEKELRALVQLVDKFKSAARGPKYELAVHLGCPRQRTESLIARLRASLKHEDWRPMRCWFPNGLDRLS